MCIVIYTGALTTGWWGGAPWHPTAVASLSTDYIQVNWLVQVFLKHFLQIPSFWAILGRAWVGCGDALAYRNQSMMKESHTASNTNI